MILNSPFGMRLAAALVCAASFGPTGDSKLCATDFPRAEITNRQIRFSEGARCYMS